MWLLFAFLSALFAGLTAILAKCGIENMDSNVATAIRTIVVLIFSWVLVFGPSNSYRRFPVASVGEDKIGTYCNKGGFKQ